MLKLRVGFLVLALVVFFGSNIKAAEQDLGHWGAYGVKVGLNDRTAFSSSVELRFKDDISDLHYIKWETGLSYKVNSIIGLGAFYRFNPSEKANDWNNAHYMLLDQNIKLASNARWDFKFRNRFHLKVGDLGRSFWRTKFQLAYKFKVNDSKASWFVDNEIWYQISELNGRDSYNVNWATTGLKFSLHDNIAFSPYYRLRSDKAVSGDWSHIHIIGTSLNFVF